MFSNLAAKRRLQTNLRGNRGTEIPGHAPLPRQNTYSSRFGSFSQRSNPGAIANAESRQKAAQAFIRASLHQRATRFLSSPGRSTHQATRATGAALARRASVKALIQGKAEVITWQSLAREFNASLDDDESNKEELLIVTQEQRHLMEEMGAGVPESECTNTSSENVELEESYDEDYTALPEGFRYIVHPHHRRKLLWDMIIALLVIYSTLTVPFAIGFDKAPSAGEQAVNRVVDIMFGLDILANFRTAYISDDGQPIPQAGRIAQHYMQGWFLLDFLSTFPFDWLGMVLQTGDSGVNVLRSAKLLKVLRLARLLKLARIAKLGALLGKETDFQISINPSILSLCKLIASMTYIAHIMACMWHWPCVYQRGSSWVLRYGLQDAPTGVRYVASLYWAFTTMTTVGYGDIVPTTNMERGMALVGMLVGATVFGYIVGSVSVMVESFDVQSALKDEKMDRIKEYVQSRHFPKRLAARVVKHYQYYYKRQTVFDCAGMLASLPTTASTSLLFTQYHETIEKLTFLRESPPLFVAELVPRLKPCYTKAGDVLFFQNELASDMYFLVSGKVDLFVSFQALDKEAGYIRERTFLLGRLFPDHLVGEAGVMLDLLQPCSAVAMAKCDACSVLREDLMAILALHTDVHAKMLLQAENLLRRINKFKLDRAPPGVPNLRGRDRYAQPNGHAGATPEPAQPPSQITTGSMDPPLGGPPHLVVVREESSLGPSMRRGSSTHQPGVQLVPLLRQAFREQENSMSISSVDSEGRGNGEGREATTGVKSQAPAAPPPLESVAYLAPVSPKGRKRTAMKIVPMDTPCAPRNPTTPPMSPYPLLVAVQPDLEAAEGAPPPKPSPSSPAGTAALSSSGHSKRPSRKRSLWDLDKEDRGVGKEFFADVEGSNDVNGSTRSASSRSTTMRVDERTRMLLRTDSARQMALNECPPDSLWHVVRWVHPESTSKALWDVCVAVLIVFSVIEVTFRLGFRQPAEGGWAVWGVLVNIVFALDMCVAFKTAFWDDGNLIVDPNKVMRQYLSRWFVVDFVSTVPFDSIFSAAMHNFGGALQGARLVRVVRLVRLFKIFRLLKMSSFFERYEESLPFSPALLRLVKLVVVMTFCAHLNACAWYAVGAQNEDFAGSWVADYCPQRLGWTMCLKDMGIGAKYLASLYWACTTMLTIGYGDIVPHFGNVHEYLVAIEGLVVGSIMFSYVIGAVVEIVLNLDPDERIRNQRLGYLTEFTRDMNLSQLQRITLRQHLNFRLTFHSVFPETEILNSLPPYLRVPATMFIHRHSLVRLPLLCEIESRNVGFISMLLPRLRPSEYQQGDIVVSSKINTREMIFVLYGICDVFRADFSSSVNAAHITARHQDQTLGLHRHTISKAQKSSRYIGSYKEGQHFGQSAVLVPQEMPLQVAVEVHARVRVEALFLDKPAYDWVMEQYPTTGQALQAKLLHVADMDNWLLLPPHHMAYLTSFFGSTDLFGQAPPAACPTSPVPSSPSARGAAWQPP